MNLVYIDFGHGRKTPGKASPDGTLEEWANNRELGKLIGIIAKSKGLLVKFTVDGDDDPSLTTRATRANIGYGEFKKQYPKGKAALISCHSDASGDGTEWMPANGWSVWTTKAKNNSDKLANAIWDSVNKNVASKWDIKMRKFSSQEKDFEENFTLLFKTNFPCCICESLFHDNKHDVELLKNKAFLQDLAEAIVEGLLNYFAMK